MHANQTDVQRILGGVQQYVIPLFQRPYSWGTKQWNTLWKDLVELCENEKSRNHFIGSIVTMPSRSVPEGVTKFILIDGQQRLTTLLVLLVAMRDRARKEPGNLGDKIDDLLLKNRHQDGSDIYKVLPSQGDRASFCALMDGTQPTKDDKLASAFEFFEKRLRLTPDIGLERLHDVIRKSLVLVSIVLDKDDNPYLIFESLNANGQPLTQADLIRNFFFMRIHVNTQEKMFSEYWKPMQERLSDDLTEFIRHFLMRDGTLVKQSDIYLTLKENIEDRSEKEIVSVLEELSSYSKYYSKLLNPGEEKSSRIAAGMIRLNRFEATTTYPFLLNVYHDYQTGKVSDNDFAAILDVLETFLIRRFICGVPTHGLNRTFASLYGQAVKTGALVDGVKQGLKDRAFPRDKEFCERFTTCKLYGDGERRQKAKLILERLEMSFGHKETIDLDTMMTIEHVMPQTPTDWWKQELGEEWEVTHETWLDTVGNLTLTGYNPELSNANFASKKVILQTSHVELSRYITAAETWDEQAIGLRGEDLATRALKIWPNFAGGKEDTGGATSEEDDEQEDVKLLTSKVIEQLGGEVERIGSGKRFFCRLRDGKIINIKYSKRHSDYYWFGLHASLWEDMVKAEVTHVAFILASQGFATLPISMVKKYIAEAGTSPKSDGTVRHYHVLISLEPNLEFFHHGKPARISLRAFYTKFDS